MNEEYKDMFYLPVRVAELQTSFSRKTVLLAYQLR